MLTDVEIAQSAKMKPIKEIAQKVGLDEDDLELYGKYKAKISLEAISKLNSCWRRKNNNNDWLVTSLKQTRKKISCGYARTKFRALFWC